MVSLQVSLLLVVACLTQAVPRDFNYARDPSREIDSSEYGQHRGPRRTSCECGWSNKAGGRVVGGREARVNEYPHMVGLMLNGRPSVFCGGSIITERHVITAAHCTDRIPATSISVIVGSHDPMRPYLTPSQQVYRVVSKKEHERYSQTNNINDISILTVGSPIHFGSNKMVGPVCMPTLSANQLERDYVRVSGWGTTSFRGPQSSKLLKVDLRVIRLDQCAMSYRNLDGYQTQFCTFAKNKDACQGDSGGPVTWLDPQTNRYTLMGLVSYGKDCATIAPGVNTDVYSFMSWIERNTAGYSVCRKV